MKTRIALDPLRGFRDIVFDEAEEISHLIQLFKEVVREHGYREVIPPTLERFELFALKSGEEIRRSMYVFKDKAGREVALRPEVTASIARIYLRLLRPLPKPLRLYYVANCFRYEEPQRARYREFIQAGVELIGDSTILSDLEVITLLLEYYARLGILKDIKLILGNTRIYRKLFNIFKIPEEVQDMILHQMDKKNYDEALKIATQHGGTKLAGILEELWNSTPQEVIKKVPEELSTVLDAINELLRVSEVVKQVYDVDLETDLSFARGLAYYTGIIFEVKIPGFPVSIAGGGRYDTLIELYGGEPTPGTGFAIGIDRTQAALKHLGRSIPSYSKRSRIAIILLNKDVQAITTALQVKRILTSQKIAVEMIWKGKLGKILPRLGREGVKHAIIIGEREAKTNTIIIRNLEKHEQQRLSLNDLQSVLEQLIQG